MYVIRKLFSLLCFYCLILAASLCSQIDQWLNPRRLSLFSHFSTFAFPSCKSMFRYLDKGIRDFLRAPRWRLICSTAKWAVIEDAICWMLVQWSCVFLLPCVRTVAWELDFMIEIQAERFCACILAEVSKYLTDFLMLLTVEAFCYVNSFILSTSHIFAIRSSLILMPGVLLSCNRTLHQSSSIRYVK